jgi:hypothetical protein
LMDLTVAKIAARIAKDQPDNAAQAQSLATQIEAANRRANLISSNRDVANYEYWRIRCDLEQTPESLKAREFAHQAALAFKDGDPTKAATLYEQCFVEWGKALDQFPEMPKDSTTGGDLMEFIDAYAKVLEQVDESLEDEEVANRFALWELLEINDQTGKYAAAIAEHKKRQGKFFDPTDAIPKAIDASPK